MRSPTLSAKRGLDLTMVAVMVLSGVVALAGPADAAVTVGKAVAAPLTGPALTETALVITGTGFKTGALRNVGEVTFQTGNSACSTNPTGTHASGLAITSATKLVVKTPVSLPVGAAKVCVYDTTSPVLTASVLMAAGSYTAYAAPTVSLISPAAGTVAGGAAITIVGSGFTAKTTATIGGSVVTGLKQVSATKLTGIAPSHAAGSGVVVVKTEGGPSAVDAVTPVAYDYKNAVVLVGDTTGPSGFLPDGVTPVADTTIDITGVGFENLDFAGAKATVALVTGVYASDNVGTDCLNITVVSDQEIVCEVPGSTMSEGAYIVTVVNTDTPADFQSVVSSSATFTVAAF